MEKKEFIKVKNKEKKRKKRVAIARGERPDPKMLRFSIAPPLLPLAVAGPETVLVPVVGCSSSNEADRDASETLQLSSFISRKQMKELEAEAFSSACSKNFSVVIDCSWECQLKGTSHKVTAALCFT